MTVQAIHVYPVNRRKQSTHRTDRTRTCWCVPERMNVCSEADPNGNCQPGCWRCGGRGLIPVYDASLPVLLIHKAGQFMDTP